MSGGNQQKLAFGRYVGRQANGVLLMNEPTRGIDVGARAEIYRLMRTFCEEGYALVMASSDLEEIVGVGDVVITSIAAARSAIIGAAKSQCIASSPISPIRRTARHDRTGNERTRDTSFLAR